MKYAELFLPVPSMGSKLGLSAQRKDINLVLGCLRKGRCGGKLYLKGRRNGKSKKIS
jgi:hypothetical protein